MCRKPLVFCLLAVTLAALSCTGKAPSKESAPAGAALDRIQGKAQILMEPSAASDAALNAGGSSVYLWVGLRRYRLFLRTPAEVVHGKEYVVEGIHAQKVIDDIGDPDQGKNGYPLQSSCERVVRMAWSGLAFDAVDGYASVLRIRVMRYPARPVFLVTRLRPVSAGETGEAKENVEEPDIPEVSVAAEKERAFLIEGPTTQTAPLWEPAGGAVRCKVVINSTGKISALESGTQLCEAVPWSQFKYQPPSQGGHPVKVKTEVEVSFEPRK
jgi:hypothetical protein